MKKNIFIVFLFLICLPSSGQIPSTPSTQADALIRQMTIDEKIGQLNQYTSDLAGIVDAGK